jgi:hypothetical protein
MAKEKSGRKKGSRNRGYFLRKSRGWYVVDGSRLLPLRYEDGTPIKAADADEQDLRDAYARWRLDKQERIRQTGPQPGDGVTVLGACPRISRVVPWSSIVRVEVIFRWARTGGARF